jgi:small subunit ribosomal protein S8
VIRELVASPSRACAVRRAVEEIPRVRNGLGMAILSTPKGVMTDRGARTNRVGGELLAIVW